MNERLICLDGHMATVRKFQALDRVPCGDEEPLVRCRVWFEVENLTQADLQSTASPKAAVAVLSDADDSEGSHVDRLAIKRTYAVFSLHLESGGNTTVLDAVTVVLTPTVRGVEGTTVFAFTVETDLSVVDSSNLLKLLGGEVALTTVDLQLSLLSEVAA